MELKVSIDKKQSVTRAVIENTPQLKKLRKIGAAVTILAIVCSAAYLLANLLIPELGTVIIQGEAVKNYLGVVLGTLSTFIIIFFFAIVFRTVLGKLSGRDINERTDESLVISENSIVYAYRIKYFSTPVSRNIITLPITGINSVEYCAATSRMVFRGAFTSSYASDYSSERTPRGSSEKLNEFTIYDYFEPGLIQTLKSFGVTINKGNET